MPLAHTRCPQCGEQNLPTDLVCLKCGADMVENVESEPGVPDLVKEYAEPTGPVASGLRYSITLAVLFGSSAAAVWYMVPQAWWVRCELALAAWWLIWFVTLCVLLSSGRKIVDDYRDRAPRDTPVDEYSGYNSGYGYYNPRAKYMVEMAILMIFTVVAYGILLGLLTCATERSRGAAWSGLVAAGWALVWATAYVAPAAIVIALWVAT